MAICPLAGPEQNKAAAGTIARLSNDDDVLQTEWATEETAPTHDRNLDESLGGLGGDGGWDIGFMAFLGWLSNKLN